ncbi:hypothetical protein K7432_014084 [Basidiobolus ranarum]|uniref:1-alkyl-2-acetylglycerophosphocholine esterase n=1 Tax=Basidiobolus ranarum TaxID=34480 RepID=A0ABR2VPY2_9FUNG
MMNIKVLTAIALYTASITLIHGASSKVTLPSLSGKFKVGTVKMHLIDNSRVDPYALDSRKRALMVQLFYPTKNTDRCPVSPYMPTVTGQFESQLYGLPNNTLESIQTWAHLGAPIAHSNPPIVLFSPGLGVTRYLYTALLSDLASRGYLVAAIDHPYDADIVEFPNGELVTGTIRGDMTPEEASNAVDVRAQDVSFILDQLKSLEIKKQVPALSKKLDVRRVVMFGHSFGGAAAATSMLKDTRIVAGADLDGSLWGSVVDKGLDRPFLLMGPTQSNLSSDPSWAKIWPNLRSWRLLLKLADSEHLTFSDLPVLVNILNLTNPALDPLIGSINGLKVLEIQRTYISAFLDRIFRETDNPILQRPDSRFPEITLEN